MKVLATFFWVLLLVAVPTWAQQSVSTTIIIQDEGATQGRVRTVNFTGAPVTCTVSGSVATCTVSSGAVSVSSTSLNMTGETKKRFTITDAAVSPTSKIVITNTRPSVTQDNDEGHVYDISIVSRGSGTFDVLVRVADPDADYQPPTETIEVNYVVG